MKSAGLFPRNLFLNRHKTYLRSFATPTPSIFLPLYKICIRLHLQCAIKHSTLSYPSTQRLALKSVKRLQHVSYETALQQLRQYPSSRSPMVFLHPSNPYQAAPYPPLSSTNKNGLPSVTKTAVPFWIKLPAEMYHSRHFWRPTSCPCSLKYPCYSPPPTAHSLCTHGPT